jgi:hypothetical protein
MLDMTTTFSTSYVHHGKRLKIEPSTDDESRGGSRALGEAHSAALRAKRKAYAAKVTRQSFRKAKAPKKG